MEAIYIPGLLKLPDQTEVIEVNECLAGLETLTPVRGRLKVTHQGNYLEVSGQGSTILTLTCHRCLQQYNHRLILDTSELIWLDDLAEQSNYVPLEQEILLEDLVETLHPQGYFQVDTWLYEQLCLVMPLQQLCDQECLGIPINEQGSMSLKDRRWEALEAFKGKLPG
ncbi:MAG: DUF177 domain-containing protein [Symploca sp. SIO1A3]|nr:DUF177 domain-containing protein [Symploca sp. SIO2C1]NER53091.1 DUF177 domain-containing protein [Symploca sp. SIO1A3]